MAIKHYFLGANGPKGFVSLYREFCSPDSGNFLWVIKGGPGCGKSTFMKKIGKAAEDAGLDVEYVLCSSDPDSLDGVLIPQWHVGYADGTGRLRMFWTSPSQRRQARISISGSSTISTPSGRSFRACAR